MTMRNHVVAAAAMVLSAILSPSESKATLIGVDFNGTPGVDGYYDTVRNITWLADANYAATVGFASGGLMNLTTATSWAAALSINGITGWRLADVAAPDLSCTDPVTSTGYNCTGGDLGYMFYTVMGGTAGAAISASHNANYSLFSNLIDAEYWSGVIDTSSHFGYFFSESLAPDQTPAGYVSEDYPDHSKLAWLVHDGDIAGVAEVPEPTTLVLFGTGLLGLGALRGRRR
jgi:hypothetical protein